MISIISIIALVLLIIFAVIIIAFVVAVDTNTSAEEKRLEDEEQMEYLKKYMEKKDKK